MQNGISSLRNHYGVWSNRCGKGSWLQILADHIADIHHDRRNGEFQTPWHHSPGNYQHFPWNIKPRSASRDSSRPLYGNLQRIVVWFTFHFEEIRHSGRRALYSARRASRYFSAKTLSRNAGSSVLKDVPAYLANSEEDALNYLFEGETNRSISCHEMNKTSSRFAAWRLILGLVLVIFIQGLIAFSQFTWKPNHAWSRRKKSRTASCSLSIWPVLNDYPKHNRMPSHPKKRCVRNI